MNPPSILIVEDGDEYLDSLRGLRAACFWLQAKSARAATDMLASHDVAGAVLDMRFDRSPRERLCGDLAAVTRQLGGDGERAWRYLAQHQGLFVLAELRAMGWAGPVLIAYDFTRELRRFEALRRTYAPLDWIGDDANADTWQRKLGELFGRSGATA